MRHLSQTQIYLEGRFQTFLDIHDGCKLLSLSLFEEREKLAARVAARHRRVSIVLFFRKVVQRHARDTRVEHGACRRPSPPPRQRRAKDAAAEIAILRMIFQ